jgi:hypothetical protein
LRRIYAADTIPYPAESRREQHATWQGRGTLVNLINALKHSGFIAP